MFYFVCHTVSVLLKKIQFVSGFVLLLTAIIMLQQATAENTVILFTSQEKLETMPLQNLGDKQSIVVLLFLTGCSNINLLYIIISPPNQKVRTLSHFKTRTGRRGEGQGVVQSKLQFFFDLRRASSLPRVGSEYAKIPFPSTTRTRSLLLTILIIVGIILISWQFSFCLVTK